MQTIILVPQTFMSIILMSNVIGNPFICEAGDSIHLYYCYRVGDRGGITSKEIISNLVGKRKLPKYGLLLVYLRVLFC